MTLVNIINIIKLFIKKKKNFNAKKIIYYHYNKKMLYKYLYQIFKKLMLVLATFIYLIRDNNKKMILK